MRGARMTFVSLTPLSLTLLSLSLLSSAVAARATLDVAVAHPQAHGLASTRDWVARALLPELGRPWRLLPQEVRLGDISHALPRGGLLITAAPLGEALAAVTTPVAILLVGDASCTADVAWYARAAFVVRTHWCAGIEEAPNVAWMPPPWHTPPNVRSFAQHRHRHLPFHLRSFDFSLVGRASREAQQMQLAAGLREGGELRLHAGLADPEKARTVQQPAAVYSSILQESRAALVPAGQRTPVQETPRLYEALQHGAVPLMLSSSSPVGRRLQDMGLAMRNVRRDLAPLLDRIAGPEGAELALKVQHMWDDERGEALAQFRTLVDEMLGD